MTSQRTPIWLDCDTGHDDAFAILLAAHSPNVDLLGISTVYGNAPLQNTTYNTRAILKAIGRTDVPVYPGSAKPFCREVVHSPEIHGETGLDGTTLLPVPDVPEQSGTKAIEAMYQALIATPKASAWFVPTGALTNAALLFATHPDLADHIGGLSIMGGAIGGNFTKAPMGEVNREGERFGNITPYAEFNVYIDPESAKSLLSNPVLASKTTLVTLDLTHLFLATEKVQRDILYTSDPANVNDCSYEPSPVRRLFLEIVHFFAKTYADVFGIIAGPPVHDVLAVAAAFAPEIFHAKGPDGSEQRHLVEVITQGAHSSDSSATQNELNGDTTARKKQSKRTSGVVTDKASSQCGQTLATTLPPYWAGTRVPNALDADAVWQMLERCLKSAEESTGWVP